MHPKPRTTRRKKVRERQAGDDVKGTDWTELVVIDSSAGRGRGRGAVRGRGRGGRGRR
jgi:hypothetical protein